MKTFAVWFGMSNQLIKIFGVWILQADLRVIRTLKAHQLYVNKVRNDKTDDTCRRCAKINLIKKEKRKK